MQVGGILCPEQERTLLGSRRCERLDAADRWKGLLREPARVTKTVHPQPGLRHIDRDDRRAAGVLIAHLHPAPAAAGCRRHRQGILTADIGGLRPGELIPAEDALVGTPEEIHIGAA